MKVKKTYVVTIEYEEDELKSGVGNMKALLGISDERVQYLFLLCEKQAEAARKRGEKRFDASAALIQLLDSGELSGNEVFAYILAGFKSSHDMKSYGAALLERMARE